jgi:hypothetical protein
MSATFPASSQMSVEEMSFCLAGRVLRLAGREFPKIALILVPGHLQCASLLQTYVLETYLVGKTRLQILLVHIVSRTASQVCGVNIDHFTVPALYPPFGSHRYM